MLNHGYKLVNSLFRANQAASNVLQTCKKQASLSLREFQYENSDGETGTLMNRFVRHIALENIKSLPIVPKKIKYSQYYPVTDHRIFLKELKNTDESQLSRLLVYTTNYRTNADLNKLVRVINDLDSEYDRRIERLNYDDLFQLMYNFMLLIPNKITNLDFYRRGIERMVNDFAHVEANQTKEYFVQIIFYLGLSKKSRQSMDLMHNFLNSYLDHFLEDLDEIEFAIVTNAVFKCSMKLLNDRFNERLKKEVLKLNPEENVDLPLLVTFVKSMRLNRVKSSEVVDKIGHLLEGEALQEAEFRGLTHLFALFAENKEISKQTSQLLNSKCMEMVQLENERTRDRDYTIAPEFRQKDLRTFLWANAFLNLKYLNQHHLQLITDLFLYHVNQEEPNYKMDDLVDASLSLIMLNHYPRRLLTMIQKEGGFYKNSRKQDRVKLDSRFYLLNSCLGIEAPQLLTEEWKSHKSTDLQTIAPDFLIKNREIFAKLGDCLQDLKSQLNINNVVPIVPIRYSNIASYLVQFDSEDTVLIDVLDQTNTLHDEQTPHGIMALKLRLLKSLKLDVIELLAKDMTTPEQMKTVVTERLMNHFSESEDEAQDVVK